MKAQAQFTIHSLNDVITATTAPTNPYKGQLWVDTSQSPPVTKVYSGSAWKEQNGTDILRSDISTLTDNQSSFQADLYGIASQVQTLTMRVSTAESNGQATYIQLQTVRSQVTTLEQTSSEISAAVEDKLDAEYGTSYSSFAWSLTADGFFLTANGSSVMSVSSSGLSVRGSITADSGTIGGFTIAESNLHTGSKTSYSSSTSGVFIGTTGIGLGTGNFYVTSGGTLYARSGTVGGFTLSTNYIYGGTIGTDGSVMIGKSYSTAKSIGGSASLSTWGLILGANFGVPRSGALYCNDVHLTGEITATSGSFTGSITCSDGTIGGFTINSTSLTNTTGSSYIQITSGNYITRLSANSIYGSYDSENGNTGWRLNLNEISISNYSSTYSGVKLLPYYKKRTSSTAMSQSTVYEGAITTVNNTYYDADSSRTIRTATPFIIGVPREYADSPYVPFFEWGAYARFVNYQTAELVYDSAYSGNWQLRNVSGSTYSLTTLIPYLYALYPKKFYFWTYSSSLGGDQWASISSSTHGLSSVTGAIAIPRATSSSLSGYPYNGCLCVRISGTTVYVGNDNGNVNGGFYCLIFGS